MHGDFVLAVYRQTSAGLEMVHLLYLGRIISCVVTCEGRSRQGF